MPTRSPSRRRRRLWWNDLPLEELLDVRLCDLELSIEGSILEGRLERLYGELARAGLRFRPSVWLSTDWFSPMGVPGFAIPFYLAHPRLVRLERSRMLEVEGSSAEDCRKLLRHETGHAIDSAYRLRRRKRWRETFGSPSLPYRQTYAPRPSSRHFVLNVDNWYAQSHPLEDFAETFAVWLAPRSRWRSAYAGWPALGKLEYVDALMQEIADRPAAVRSRERTDAVSGIRITLREYYRRKSVRYGHDDRSGYDRELLRLFSEEPNRRGRPRAAAFLRRHQASLRRDVAYWTELPQIVVDRVVDDMVLRATKLRLHLNRSQRETREAAALLIAKRTLALVRRHSHEYHR